MYQTIVHREFYKSPARTDIYNIMESGGRGFCRIRLDRYEACIIALHVDSRDRRHGIATALLDKADELISSKKLPVVVDVSENTPLWMIEMWRRRGYRLQTCIR